MRAKVLDYAQGEPTCNFSNLQCTILSSIQRLLRFRRDDALKTFFFETQLSRLPALTFSGY